MVSSKRLKTLCLVAASATILVAAGCHPSSETDAKTSTAETQELSTVLHVQEASGARAECTLYGEAFDGPTLSSLGTHTLDLVLDDSHSCNPLVVYMADGNNDLDRQLAVRRYLEDRGGLKSEQIEFRAGPNPDSNSPANVGIANYEKTDTAADSTSSSTASH